MSLLNQQNNKDKKKGNKNNPGNKSQGSKFIAKSGKGAGFSLKPAVREEVKITALVAGKFNLRSCISLVITRDIAGWQPGGKTR